LRARARCDAPHADRARAPVAARRSPAAQPLTARHVRTRPGTRNRCARRLRNMAAAAAAQLPGRHGLVAPFLRREPVHLLHGRPAQPRRADRACRSAARPIAAGRSAAAGAGADRNRDQLCDDCIAPRGAAGGPRRRRHRPCGRVRGRAMNAWPQHLVVVPVVLPLVAAAVLLAIDEQRRALKRTVAFVCLVALLVAALALVQAAGEGAPLVYRVGGWPAPFGIVLVADRLSAVMVLLATVLGLAAFLFACARWDRAGPRFHSLLQILLMGVNGAFLTGDLFNLFVFFEVLLAASYGLALHGSGAARVQASLHYIVVNLTASRLFLIGAAMIYGVTGTLNLADLGAHIPAVAAADRGLVEAGAAILAVAFLVKAGTWPLCFWLP